MSYKEMMAQARQFLITHIEKQPAGKLLKFGDLTLVLAKHNVALSSKAMSDMVNNLVEENKLVRASTKRLFVPLRYAKPITNPIKLTNPVSLTDTQRITLLEEQVLAMNEQIALLHSRLL